MKHTAVMISLSYHDKKCVRMVLSANPRVSY